MQVMQEVRRGIYLFFKGDKQEETGISKGVLRRGFGVIYEVAAAERVSAALRKRAAEEAQEQ